MKKIAIIMILFVVSCKNNIYTYKKCMDETTLKQGSQFYKPLESFENILLKKQLLKGKNKNDYFNAFKSLNKKDDSLKWKSLYDKISKTKIYTNIKENRFNMINRCSHFDIKKELKKQYKKVKSETLQKFIFNKFIFKPIDDEELTIELVIFSDYKDKISRLNVLYLLFLQMDKKFNK